MVGNRSGSQDQSKVEKYKKERYAIGNVSMKDLSKKIKEFLKIVKVPYVKSIPKHEPTSSYFHIVVCLGECMMRCGGNNHHVHDGYEKEMDPSSEVNDMDEDESKNSILQKPFDKLSSENLFMDVSESECNIVNEISSQSDSSDVPTNVITELNYDDHIEPSVTVKEGSYFNIFECGRNLLDQLYVMYQRAFTASETSSKVPRGHYIYPSRERYYDIQAKLLTEKNVGMEKDKIRMAISHVKLEDEAYHERNIEILTQ